MRSMSSWRPPGDVHLGVDVAHVGLRGALGDEQLVADVGDGAPPQKERRHLHLARRQAVGLGGRIEPRCCIGASAFGSGIRPCA